MTIPGEQESQVEHMYDRDVEVPSSPITDERHLNDLASHDDSRDQLLEQYSFVLDSLVEETQYVDLEIGSQAPPDPVSQTTSILQENYAQPTTASPPREKSPFLSRFTPLEVTGVAETVFKFGKVNKPQPGTFVRPPPKSAGVDPTPIPVVVPTLPMALQTPQEPSKEKFVGAQGDANEVDMEIKTGLTTKSAPTPDVASHSLHNVSHTRRLQDPSISSLPTPTDNVHSRKLAHLTAVSVTETSVPDEDASQHPAMRPPPPDSIPIPSHALFVPHKETSAPEPCKSRPSTILSQTTNCTSTNNPTSPHPHKITQELPTPTAHPHSSVLGDPLQQVPKNASNGRSESRMSKKERKRSLKKPIGEPSITFFVQTPARHYSKVNSTKVLQNPGESPIPLGPKLKNCPFPEVHFDQQDSRHSQRAPNQSGGAPNIATAAAANDRRRRSPSPDRNCNFLQSQERSIDESTGHALLSLNEIAQERPQLVHVTESVHGNDKSTGHTITAEDNRAHAANVVNFQNPLPAPPIMEAIQEQLRLEHSYGASNSIHSRVKFPDTQSNNISNDDGVQEQSRGPARAQPEHLPRSQSQSSNRGASMTRPLRKDQLNSEGGRYPQTLHDNHATKVKKYNLGHSQGTAEKKSDEVPAERQRSQSPASVVEKYRKFLALGEGLEKTMENYEVQKEKVVSQQAEIEKLADEGAKCKVTIAQLEAEKQNLMDKLRKFMELSSKYKQHVNDVVLTQKYLKSQAATMRDKMSEAIEAAQNIRARQAKTLEDAIEDAERAANKVSRIKTEKIDVVEKLFASNNKLATQVDALTRTNKLQEATIDKHLMELSNEVHKSRALEEQLNLKRILHQEFADALKKIPSCVVTELIKDEGVIAKLLTSETTIQAKVDEFTTVIKALKDNDSESSSALTNLIEDLFMRLEFNLPSKVSLEPENSGVKLLEELKEYFNQVRVDHEAQDRLKNQISELRESNVTLSAEKNSRQFELQNVTKQVEELKRDIVDTRGQLTEKLEELITLRALPKEDPQLQAKIRDMENKNGLLQGHLDNANQEASKANRDLAALKESSLGRDEQIKQLQRKLADSQTKIKNFNEDKIKYQETCKLDGEKARQELAKSASASRATMTLKYESQIKNLEQKRAEAEAELSTFKEEMQIIQDEDTALNSQLNKLRAENTRFKEYIKQQDPLLERLEQDQPGRANFERYFTNIQSVRSEVVASQTRIQSLQNHLAQHNESSMKLLKEIEGSLRPLDTLEREKETLEDKNSKLQKQMAVLTEAHKKQQLTGSGKPDGHMSASNILWGNNAQFIPHIQTGSRSSLQVTRGVLGAYAFGSEPIGPNTEPQLYNGISAFATPQVFKQTGFGTPLHALNRSISAYEQQFEQKTPASRQRRPAQRKPSKLGQFDPTDTECLASTQSEGHQTPMHQGPHSSEGLPARAQSPTFATPFIKPFYEMTPINASSSSSLSDLTQIFEGAGSAEDHRVEAGQPTHRSRQSSRLNVSHPTESTSVSRNVDAEILKNRKATAEKLIAPPMLQQSEENKLARAKGTTDPPSTIEESSRRRQESKPLKSALKKTDGNSSKALIVDVEPFNTIPTTAHQPAPLVSNRLERSNAPNRHSNKSGTRIRSQSSKTAMVGLYNNSVSGNSSKSNSKNPKAASVPASRDQAVPNQQEYHDHASEPPMPQPKRNPSNLKRAGSPTLENNPERKAPRLTARGRPSTRRIIPDSQETSQETSYDR